MRTILVATDGSEGSTRAVRIGAEMAKELGATLTLVTIGPEYASEEHRQFAYVEGGGSPHAAETFARNVLNDAENLARQCGVSESKTSLAFGNPVREIIEIAKEENAGAIIVGRRGRGQLSGLILGSVSQKLASLAPCPVMVVP